MDPFVIEIDHPESSSSKSLKGKQVSEPELIDVDQYENVLNEKANTIDKGKAMAISFDLCMSDQVLDSAVDLYATVNKAEQELGTSSSHDLLDPDCLVYEDDDEYYDQYGYEPYDSLKIDDSYSLYQDLLDSNDLPTDVEVSVPWFPDSSAHSSIDSSADSSIEKKSKASGSNSSLAGDIPLVKESSTGPKNVTDYLGKYLFFKRFDTVEDCSDHYYFAKGSTTKQPQKDWAKKIQEEWRILENDLPETIFVRAYESRIDLLRAVIIGAEGTPYHDGLFFFDVFFPDRYPNDPPMVHYHSGGLRINPNLYNCGKVCLSLLGTWAGSPREKWQRGESTMLQVLVSIQALILNQKPYFNEPGFERTIGTVDGERNSEAYSENAFLLSLKTMMYNLKRPPKYFEEFVYGHFYSQAHDILAACKAYKEGAPVGCVVKGGVQDVEESTQKGSKKCSKNFSTSISSYILPLVKEFTEIGVKDTEKFITEETKAVNGEGSSSSNKGLLKKMTSFLSTEINQGF